MKRATAWLALFVVIACATHAAAIALTPRALMAMVMHRLSVGGTNQIVHVQRADAQQRVIVMPSPDFLYSYCVYDLAQGALHVHARVSQDSYWSVSAFDAQTDNFYALDDQSVVNGVVDLWLVPPQTPDVHDQRDATRPLQVRSPSQRGVVLFRTVIDRDDRLAELDAMRRQATCEAVPASNAAQASQAGQSSVLTQTGTGNAA